jgi:YhcH/YjgK/YiaL family protein
MIIDHLKNASPYFGAHPRLESAFKYLRNTDLGKIEAGRYEIQGTDVFVLVQNYDTKAKEKGRWEAHRKYIDIQYVYKGTELIGYANIDRLQPGAYDEGKDFWELKGEGDFVKAPAGTFLVLFPQDGHMPGIAVSGPEPVKKIVVKVRV